MTNPGELARVDVLTANIKRQLAMAYLRDLTEWRSGNDDARFSRMVDGRGAGIGSPESWLRNLASICANPVVTTHQPALRADVVAGLTAIRLALPKGVE
jgi:hypothetical protein